MALWVCIAWLALAAAPQEASRATMEGTVVQSTDGGPVEGAEVIASPVSSPEIRARTDKDGHFSIRGLTPGRYRVRVLRESYAVPPLVTVDAAAGQRITDLRISLTPGGTISGRILDDRGRPAAAAEVTALRRTYAQGRRLLLPYKTATSNDRGEYRLFWLEPGDYYIRAAKTLGGGPARTYFPSTDDPTSAVPIPVTAGSESARIDFRIQMSQTFKVSGTVSILPETGSTVGPFVQLYLVPRDSGGTDDTSVQVLNSLAGERDRNSGRFELRSVHPGRYGLYAVLPDPAGPPGRNRFAYAPVEVIHQDVSGVSLIFVPGADLKGRIVYTGEAKPPEGAPVRVQLKPSETLLPAAIVPDLSAAVEEGGEFNIQNVPALSYVVMVDPLAFGTYVDDIRQGGTSLFDSGILDVGRGLPDTVELSVSAPVATIRGTVAATPGQLAAGITVTLVPESFRQEHFALYKRTTVRPDGGYGFTEVTPGRYTLYAWETIPPGADQNADYMERFLDDGREVNLPPGSTLTLPLILISKDR